MARDGAVSPGRQTYAPRNDSPDKTTHGSPSRISSGRESRDRDARQGSSPVQTLPQLTKFTQTRVVAKRGSSRLGGQWGHRATPTPRPSPRLGGSPSGTKIDESRIESHKTVAHSRQSPNEEARAKSQPMAGPILPKRMNETCFKAAYLNKPKKSPLESTRHEIGKRSPSEGAKDIFCHQRFVMDPEPSIPGLIQPRFPPQKNSSVFEPASANSRTPESPFTPSKGLQAPQDRKPKVQPSCISISTPQSLPPRHVKHATHVSKVDLAPMFDLSPHNISPERSSDSGRAADVESNTDEEDVRPFARSRRRRLYVVDHGDASSVLGEESEPDSKKSYAPTADEESNEERDESDNESAPMSIDSPEESEAAPQGIGNTSLADQGDSLGDDTDRVTTPYRAKVERNRAKKLANFDSSAFDALIYQQSSLQPPSGVTIPARPPTRSAPTDPSERLALPVNPAIHRMHRRSEAWSRRKSKEIADRGGRKQWVGKMHERRRFLQAQSDAFEEERRIAERAGKIPPRRDPQPRTHKRPMDFADVPDDELPEDVQSNPAWMKAVAWLRSSRQQKAQRERHLHRSAEETQRFYVDMAKITGYQVV